MESMTCRLATPRGGCYEAIDSLCASVTTPNGGGNPTLTFAVKGDSVTGSVKRPTGVVVPLKGMIKGSDLKK